MIPPLFIGAKVQSLDRHFLLNQTFQVRLLMGIPPVETSNLIQIDVDTDDIMINLCHYNALYLSDVARTQNTSIIEQVPNWVL
ncbi:hypothetical protein ISO4_01378 [Alcanivorax venustensis ISO4]|uniref:Uncharacterized protein n=1 Tax=Alloalcanivorax venustensis ISO4 TaxID=1177184 RepID=A0ABS0AGZ5_9GAMM|nr:hypothetical protein [Alloalcanivorax venustensis ISO4]